MKARKSFLLRIDPALYEALEAWAQHELRSVNGQIEFVLKEALRRRGRSVTDNALPTENEQGQPSGPDPQDAT